MLFIKVMSSLKGGLINPADGAVINLIAKPRADVIVQCVAEDRAEGNEKNQRRYFKRARRSCGAGDE